MANGPFHPGHPYIEVGRTSIDGCPGRRERLEPPKSGFGITLQWIGWLPENVLELTNPSDIRGLRLPTSELVYPASSSVPCPPQNDIHVAKVRLCVYVPGTRPHGTRRIRRLIAASQQREVLNNTRCFDHVHLGLCLFLQLSIFGFLYLCAIAFAEIWPR